MGTAEPAVFDLRLSPSLVRSFTPSLKGVLPDPYLSEELFEKQATPRSVSVANVPMSLESATQDNDEDRTFVCTPKTGHLIRIARRKNLRQGLLMMTFNSSCRSYGQTKKYPISYH